MTDTVTFDNVSAASVEGVSFSVPAGSMTALITSSQEESDQLVRLMLRLIRPASGTVTVLGDDIGAASDRAVEALRRRVSVVHPSGGLISNLKVWENLVLPVEYHSLCPRSELEEKGRAALEKAAYRGRLMELPGHLSLYEKRQVALARAILCQSSLVIYNGVLAGLSGSERGTLLASAEAFHREMPGRTSIFLAPNQESLKEIALDSCIVLKEICKGSSTND